MGCDAPPHVCAECLYAPCALLGGGVDVAMMRAFLLVLVAVVAMGVVACGGGGEGVGYASGASSAIVVRAISPTGSDGVDFNYGVTELVSSGERFEIQLTCIHRVLRPCGLLSGEMEGEPGFVERVEQRTNGQVRFEVTSFPELGIVGSNTMELTADGTLAMAEVYSGHVADDLPEMDISNLWGLYPASETQLAIVDAIQPEMGLLTADNGGVQIFYTYTLDGFVFSRFPIREADDFQGLKVRSHSPLLDELLLGLGAEPQSTAYVDVHAALEDDVLDAAISCGSCGHGERWYEVSDYLAGPIVSITHGWYTMNQGLWDSIPADLQNIILEEGARHSAINRELLRGQWQKDAAAINVTEGMEANKFDESRLRDIQDASIERVIPSWVSKVGGANSEIVGVFNEKVTPILGVAIKPEGVTRTDGGGGISR